jgi:sugar/nucleoside kinase (ribokinase family)
VQRDYVTSARLLHVSDADPAAVQAARWAKAVGKEVCFDGTHFYPTVLDLLPLLDYVIVSRFFASELVAFQETGALTRAARMFSQPGGGIGAPERAPQGSRPGGQSHAFSEGVVPELRGEALLGAARSVRALGPPVVVVTEGEHGSWCASPEGEFHTPAFPVAPVVDTTGAGDVFHGAFLYARAQGWSLRRALRLGAAAGALKCRALGGRAGIPTLEEALALAEGAPTPG